MEEAHEYAIELGKQGGKNPRKIPKFSINHERFSRTIEKKFKMTPTHSSEGILTAASLSTHTSSQAFKNIEVFFAGPFFFTRPLPNIGE